MNIVLGILSWIGRLAVLGVLLLGMANCTQLGLNYASLDVEGKPAAYPPIADDPEGFLIDRERWIDRLETHITGPIPEGVTGRLIEHRIVDEEYWEGHGVLEEYVIAIEGSGKQRDFVLAVAWPKTDGPHPIIISQSFCGNQTAFDYPALTPPLPDNVDDFCGGGEPSFMGSMVMKVFGRYISTPPMQQVLDRGYAYASYYTSEVIPDSTEPARALMPDFPHGPRGEITGAVSGWAAAWSAALDVLEADPRVDTSREAIMGHSRSAKSALVAGVYDTRIDAIVAHQAGTGGSALSRDKPGETVDGMLKSYPHWFDPAYARFDADGTNTTPVDMHVLIALNAPTPLLIGNGRRDVWSDPNGSWRATLEAAPIYAASGAGGLKQDGMQDAPDDANLVFWMRPGGHSITQRDWDFWLDWLDNVMPQSDEVPGSSNEASVTPSK
ncbi:alpha/beta hydrolase [Henriciella sp. AS95]|uniref:glucuronyl esterase domain-containing protein n=1 Tax=Henriciella sp. AS95 TaxID=3135782 RepID=UPI0031829A52